MVDLVGADEAIMLVRRMVPMSKPRKTQDEKDLEKLAKKLLSTPHKPREATPAKRKVGKKPSTKRSRHA